jgi:hypothetical protein
MGSRLPAPLIFGASAWLLTTAPSPPPDIDLEISFDSARTDPIPLDGARFVERSFYVFADVSTSTANISTVRFSMRRTADEAGAPVSETFRAIQTERFVPYDFAGGSESTARPWSEPPGAYAIKAVATFTDGSTVERVSTFTINPHPDDFFQVVEGTLDRSNFRVLSDGVVLEGWNRLWLDTRWQNPGSDPFYEDLTVRYSVDGVETQVERLYPYDFAGTDGADQPRRFHAQAYGPGCHELRVEAEASFRQRGSVAYTRIIGEQTTQFCVSAPQIGWIRASASSQPTPGQHFELEGANLDAGPWNIFMDREVDELSGVRSVAFELTRESQIVLTQTERVVPFHLGGTDSMGGGRVVDLDTGRYRLNVDFNWPGGHVSSLEAFFTVGSVAAGSPPVFTALPSPMAIIGERYESTVTATDPDLGDEITYALAEAPSGMSIDPVSGLVDWMPGPADEGNAVFRVYAEDQTGMRTEEIVVITVREDGPDAPAYRLLTTLHHSVVGSQLRVSPEKLFVPRNIPGSLSVDIVSAEGETSDALAALGHGGHVEAVLRGPGLPSLRVLGLPNEPVDLPPLALTGQYRLDDVRLVDTESGVTRMVGEPASIPIEVFPQVLVSRVEARRLTYDEILERGIALDADDFSVLEFEVAFVLRGETIPVRFPVVAPKFKERTEILPALEVQERLAEAEQLNRELSKVQLPPELRVPGLDLQVQGLNFQRISPDEESEPDGPAPITGIVVIPGQVGFLNQFFSVQVYTANASPLGSGLTVNRVEAAITLPSGRDLVPNTDDDPLALARVGPEAQTQPVAPIRHPGIDGVALTSDDRPRLGPGETGIGEFLVEGRKPGLHTFDIALTGDLEGLAREATPVTGHAVGSVLVRNPKFSIAFSHPRTVRSEEPYTAAITVLNTSDAPANLVTLTLNEASLSGVVFADGQAGSVSLGTLEPGESATAEYRFIAKRTGWVALSNLTGDEGISGRFDFTMGVDERQVALSSSSIGYPEWINELPSSFRSAADRVLGQALSVATAAALPPGVRSITRGTVEQRVVELAEAGQRLRYGDAPERVFFDLMLDWHGGRTRSLGFDQILRTTQAGEQFAAEIALQAAHPVDGFGRAGIESRLVDWAGRGERWGAAMTSDLVIEPVVSRLGLATSGAAAELTESRAYAGGAGWLLPLAAPGDRGPDLMVTWRVPAETTGGRVAWVDFDGAGSGRTVELDLSTAGAEPVCYRYLPNAFPEVVIVDVGCTEQTSDQIAVSPQSVVEEPPTLLGAVQDLGPRVARPGRACAGPKFERYGTLRDYENYGTVVALLFSKPMSAASFESVGGIALENGVRAMSAALQPGGRVALVNFEAGVSELRPRTLTLTGVTDPRGNAIAQATAPIELQADDGVSVVGRVLGADGNPVAGVPVTLTMTDRVLPAPCRFVDVRLSQVTSDADGGFRFDYVMSGLTYTIGATDSRGLDPEAVALLDEVSPNGVMDDDELAFLLESPGSMERLRDAFNAYDGNEAIALAEGVDRAVFKDLVPVGSARVGSEVPVVLRFRGRATVQGTVYAADGTTPVEGAAVNLFPESSSREKGRGLFSGVDGRFAFHGVPLGSFTVNVTTADGRQGIVAGRMGEPGATETVDVVLSDQPVRVGTIEGWIVEADGVTAQPGAEVFVLDAEDRVLAASRANAEGFVRLHPVPEGTHTAVALAVNGRRASERSLVVVAENAVSFVELRFAATARVEGRVEFANGTPAANALVAGGEILVRTDPQGRFVLTGVPSGRRQIAAGLEKNPAAGVDFTRLGSSTVDVVPGRTNFAVVRFTPQGRLTGRVFDAAGTAVGSVRVALPVDQGFYWTNADASGRYAFEPLALGTYVVSAPAPAVVDADSAIAAIEGGNVEEIATAVGEVLEQYASGFSPEPPTGRFGFSQGRLTFDGETATADIRYLPEGTVDGLVLNDRGVPIGADVTLFGLTRGKSGSPTLGQIALVTSDPGTGAFSFPRLPVGSYMVEASSPFYPRVAVVRGETFVGNADVSGLVLQFAEATEENGRITGTVLADGQAVSGATVEIDFFDLTITTDADGRFDTQLDLPARPYVVEVTGPTGRVGREIATAVGGDTVDVTVNLLAADGTIDVAVVSADGTAADGATVEIVQGSYPRDTASLVTDAAGLASLSSVKEGAYSATACRLASAVRLCGTERFDVGAAETVPVTITLEGSGTIGGTFVEEDGSTPVASAQISVEDVGFTTTDAAGAFELEGVPLGTHRVVGFNPVTGRGAFATADLTYAGQTVTVRLEEEVLGEVVGRVLDDDGFTTVAGAFVHYRSSNPLFDPLTVTTDPGGRFTIPGVPPGDLALRATDPIETSKAGLASATMPDPAETLDVDIAFPPRGEATFLVRTATGAPAARARVNVDNTTVVAGADGRVTVTNLPLGRLEVRAHHRADDRSRSRASGSVDVIAGGGAPELELALSGVASIAGTVFDAQGATVAGAAVTLELQPDIRGFGDSSDGPDLVLSGADGSYAFDNVALGGARVVATSGALAAAENAEPNAADQFVTLNLTLTESATVSGRLLRANGITPLSGAEIIVRYDAPSGADGAAAATTGFDGRFEVQGIPVGAIAVTANVATFDGVLFHEDVIPPGAGDFDVGDLVLDEERPRVASIVPRAGAQGVPVDSIVEITFSEAMDTRFDDADAAYLLDADATVVPAVLAWVLDPVSGEHRTLTLTPETELASEATYTVVVLTDPLGPVAGPTDLAGRFMSSAFTSTFETIDAEPPQILSVSPADGAVQVASDAVLRVTFDEPMDASSISFTLTGPGGAVLGTTSLVLNRQVAVFTPNGFFDPNATYAAELTGATDLAGNSADGLPRASTFDTIDTQGPVITDLRLFAASTVVRGATVDFEAVLAGPEPDVVVQLTADLQTFVSGATGSRVVGFRVPAAASSLFLRARAIDRFGNYGPYYEETFPVGANQPPTVTVVRVDPPSGPLLSGRSYRFDVQATDDSFVATTEASVQGAIVRSESAAGPTLTVTGVVPASLGPGRTITVEGRAVDNAGVTAVPDTVTLNVEDGTAPSLSLTTSTLNVEAGGTVTVDASASDAFGVSTLRLEATGVLSSNQGGPVSPVATSASQTFTLNIPSTAVLGDSAFVRVIAEDEAGNSLTRTRTINVIDTTPPTVLSVTPPDGATGVDLRPQVVATFSEPVYGVSDQSFFLSGPGGTVVPVTVVSMSGASSAWLEPSSSLTATTTYTVHLTAGITDVSGLSIPAQTTTFTTMNAVTGPMLARVEPDDGATNVSLAPTIDYAFNLALDPTSVTASILTVEDDLGNPVTVDSVQLVDGNRTIRFTLADILDPDVEYTLSLAGTPTDGSGNAIRDTTGLTFSTLATTFRTASIELVVDGALRGVEGHGVPARIDSGTEADVVAAVWSLDGVEVATTYGPEPAWAFAVPELSEITGTQVALEAEVVLAGHAGRVVLAPVDITVEARTSDDDGDGPSNADEAAGGTDPFVADASDDPDLDGLTNVQELTLGTDPDDDDTDDDGATDDVDLDPLDGAAAPIAGSELLQREYIGHAAETLELPADTRLQAPWTVELTVRPITTGTVFSSGPNDAVEVTYDSTAQAFSFGFETVSQPAQTWVAPYVSRTYQLARISLRYDGARFRAYIDGRIAVDAAYSGDVAYAATGGPVLGDGIWAGFNDIRVWDVARSAADIRATTTRVLTGVEPGLFAYWPIDQASSTTYTDATGGGRDAVISGGITGSGFWLNSDEHVQIDPADHQFYLAATRYGSFSPRYEVVRMPSHGRLYDMSGSTVYGEIDSAGAVSFNSLLYVADPGYFGVDSFTYVVDDGAGRTSKQPAVLSVESAPERRWTGLDPVDGSDWNRAGNWAPTGVPIETDNVHIGENAGTIVVPSGIGVGSLRVGAGSTLNLGTGDLTVAGHLLNAGRIDGTGTVTLTGRKTVFEGELPNVNVQGLVRTQGDVTISGDLDLSSWAGLEIGPHSLHVTGSFIHRRNDFVMDDVDAELDVDGDFTMCGADLRQGTLRVGGDFTVTCAAAFDVEPGFSVVLDGTAAQTVEVPNSVAWRRGFDDLVIRNPAGVTFASEISISGTLTVESGSRITTSQQLSVANLRLDSNATLDGSGNIDVTGELRLASGATLDADAVDTSATLILDPSASLTVASFELRAPGPMPDVTFTHLILQADLELDRDLSVPGDLTIVGPAGELDLNGHAVDVTGDVDVARGRIDMVNASDALTVKGAFRTGSTFAGAGCRSTDSAFTAGVLTVEGDFSAQSVCGTSFPASGGHVTVLSGPAAKTLQMRLGQSIYNHFGDLVIRGGPVEVLSSSQGDLYAVGDVVIDADVGNAGAGSSLVIEGDLDLLGSATVDLDVLAVEGTFTPESASRVDARVEARLHDLAVGVGTVVTDDLTLGGFLTIPSTYVFDSLTVDGDLVLDQARTLGGDLWIESTASLDLDGHELDIGGGVRVQGGLTMTSSTSVLDVAGDMYLGWSPCGLKAGNLSAGAIEVEGDLWAYNCPASYPMARDFEIVLDGLSPQIVRVFSSRTRFNGSGYALGTVRVANAAGATASTNVWIAGDLMLDPSASLDASSLHVQGVLTVPLGATLDTSYELYLESDPALAGGVLVDRVVLAGATAEVPDIPTYGSLFIESDVELGADLSVTANLEVDAGSLHTRGYAADVGSQLRVESGAVLTNDGMMTLPALADFRVYGSLINEAAGAIAVGDYFIVSGSGTVTNQGSITAGRCSLSGTVTGNAVGCP